MEHRFGIKVNNEVCDLLRIKRSDVIMELVEMQAEEMDKDYDMSDFRKLLMNGIKGYKYYTDQELAEEYNSEAHRYVHSYKMCDGVEVVDDYDSWYTVYLGNSVRFDRDYSYGRVQAKNAKMALLKAREDYRPALDAQEYKGMFVKEGWC